MNRPSRGPLNPTKVDHSTDAYDTIDWLVKNVPSPTASVGSIGTSYDGFTALMTLVNPHPALKASFRSIRWSMCGRATIGSTTAPSDRK